jgi:hypothetical protein
LFCRESDRDSGPTVSAAIIRFAFPTIALLTVHVAWASETCRYSGTTSYSGQVSVETIASIANGETTIDVTARVNARSFGFLGWQYLYQEISTSRGGELRSVAVNSRYSVAGSIRRQQWDLFNRGPDGMTAFRVQANSLADLQQRHSGFVRHWELETFGQPWLADYAAASPDRRADLDLPRTAVPPEMGTPLALAYYWVRWAPKEGRDVAIFLPGFKKNARIDLHVASLGLDANGQLHLRSAVRHPQLSDTEISTGDAWISPGHHLMRVTFDARGDHASAQGELHPEGCSGIP